MLSKSYLVILVVFCLYWQASRCDDAQVCQDYVRDLQAKYPNYDVNTLPPEEKYYVLYSGRGGALDFGNRKECEAQPSMRYLALIEEMSQFDMADTHAQRESGLCLRKECAPDIIRNTPNMLQDLFRLNNWNVNGDLRIHGMDESPPKTDYYYYSVYLHLTLISLVAITTVIGIFYRYQHSQRNAGDSSAAPPKLHWFVEAFDGYTSLRTLWQTAKEQKQNDNIAIFGFLRVMAIWWVISTHAFGIVGASSKQGGPCVGLCFYIAQGPYGVNYFFFMGGFLAVYILCPKFASEGITIKSFLMHFKHRWMRIWPPCMTAIIFYWLVLNYMLNGPMWGRYSVAASACDRFWTWKLSLLDNNTITGGPNCAAWTWYASVDIQSYCFVILLAYIHSKTRLGGFLLCGLFTYKSLVQSSITGARGSDFYNYYINAYSRANEIFIGAAFGLHYYDYAKRNDKANVYYICEKFALIKYGIIMSGIYLNYYVVYYVPIYQIQYNDWLIRGKIYMVLATGLMFGPICTKEQFWLKDFLNIRVWQVLGKLSFGGYLYHLPILLAVRFSRDDMSPQFNEQELEETTITVIKWTYVVSVFYYMIAERPIGAIEAHFSKHKKASPPALVKPEATKPEVAEAAKPSFIALPPISTAKPVFDKRQESPLVASASQMLDIDSESILDVSNYGSDGAPRTSSKLKRKLKSNKPDKNQYQPL